MMLESHFNLPCYYGDVAGEQHDHIEEFCDLTDQPVNRNRTILLWQNRNQTQNLQGNFNPL